MEFCEEKKMHSQSNMTTKKPNDNSQGLTKQNQAMVQSLH